MVVILDKDLSEMIFMIPTFSVIGTPFQHTGLHVHYVNISYSTVG